MSIPNPAEQLPGDVAAYTASPADAAERALAQLPVAFDLGDDGIDYDTLYGSG